MSEVPTIYPFSSIKMTLTSLIFFFKSIKLILGQLPEFVGSLTMFLNNLKCVTFSITNLWWQFPSCIGLYRKCVCTIKIFIMATYCKKFHRICLNSLQCHHKAGRPKHIARYGIDTHSDNTPCILWKERERKKERRNRKNHGVSNMCNMA